MSHLETYGTFEAPTFRSHPLLRSDLMSSNWSWASRALHVSRKAELLWGHRSYIAPLGRGLGRARGRCAQQVCTHVCMALCACGGV